MRGQEDPLDILKGDKMEKMEKPPVKGAMLKKNPVTGEMYWDCPTPKLRRKKSNQFAPKWSGRVKLPYQSREKKPGAGL